MGERHETRATRPGAPRLSDRAGAIFWIGIASTISLAGPRAAVPSAAQSPPPSQSSEAETRSAPTNEPGAATTPLTARQWEAQVNAATSAAEQGKMDEATVLLEKLWQQRLEVFPEEKYPAGHILFPHMAFVLTAAAQQLGDAERFHKYARLGAEAANQVFPPDRYPQGHMLQADCLKAYAISLSLQGLDEQALPHMRRAVEINEAFRERIQIHPHRVSSLYVSYANLLTELGRFDEALRAAAAAKKFAAPVGENGVTASDLRTMYRAQMAVAGAAHALGNLDEAEEQFRQCVQLADKLGELSADKVLKERGTSRLYLGRVLREKREFETASVTFQECLEIAKTANYPAIAATCHQELGRCNFEQGRRAQAVDSFRQAIAGFLPNNESVRSTLPDRMQAINDLATVLDDLGHSDEAKKLLRQAIRELGETEVECERKAAIACNLASILIREGDFVESHRVLETAMLAESKIVSIHRKSRASFFIQHQLAISAFLGADYLRAEQHARKALVLARSFENFHRNTTSLVAQMDCIVVLAYASEKSFKDSRLHSSLLELSDRLSTAKPDTLGLHLEYTLYLLDAAQGNDQLAHERLRNLISRWEIATSSQAILQRNQVLVAFAACKRRLGQYEDALHLFSTVLQKLPQRPGTGQLRATTLTSMGRSQVAAGHIDAAFETFFSAALIEPDMVQAYVEGSAELPALRYVLTKLRAHDQLLSLLAKRPEMAARVYQHVWQRHSMLESVFTLRARSRRENQLASQNPEYARYLQLRREIATLTLSNVFQSAANDSTLAELRQLNREKERLESSLSIPLPPTQSTGSPHDLITKLPEDTAVLEFVQYRHYAYGHEAGGDAREQGEPRYGVFVLVPQGQPQFVGLGTCNSIDREIAAWRTKIDQGFSVSCGGPLRTLVWQPVEELLPKGIRRILISSGGHLDRVAWDALPLPDRRTPLITSFNISLVPSARFVLDQLERGRAGLASTDVLAVGDIDFGTPDDSSTTPSHTYWLPLSGTKAELETFARHVHPDKLTTLKGKEATRDRIVQALPNASIVHLATHGMIAPNADSLFAVHLRPRTEIDVRQLSPVGRNPFALIGLACAGANADPVDGVLTAEEISVLPLDRLQLVVLSACHSGNGAVADTEGVMSLRTAFHIAGAGGVISSLWTADDRGTAVLMQNFYRFLWDEKLPADQALRQAKLASLRLHADRSSRERAPNFGQTESIQVSGEPLSPKYWAGFVYSGP